MESVMRYALPLCGVFLVLASVAKAADDKPAPKDKPDPLAEKFIPIGSVAGVVQNAPGEDGVFKIKVTLRYLEANLQAQANLLKEEQQLVSRQAAAMRIRNPIQRQQEFIRIFQAAQNMGRENLFTLKEVQKDLEFEMVDETKLRTAEPPIAFDDKGDPRKYTPDELKELKGPDNLPGYTADRDALRSGRIVVVAAGLRKPPPGEKPLAEEKPEAVMILIVGEK
jgi:hypothetical protein